MKYITLISVTYCVFVAFSLHWIDFFMFVPSCFSTVFCTREAECSSWWLLAWNCRCSTKDVSVMSIICFWLWCQFAAFNVRPLWPNKCCVCVFLHPRTFADWLIDWLMGFLREGSMIEQVDGLILILVQSFFYSKIQELFYFHYSIMRRAFTWMTFLPRL